MKIVFVDDITNIIPAKFSSNILLSETFCTFTKKDHLEKCLPVNEKQTSVKKYVYQNVSRSV